MATLKDLKKRIRTVRNTRQITRAMKAVAVSKLRRAQGTLDSTRRYSEALSSVAGHLLAATPDVDHEYRRLVADPKRVTVVVVSADRGLCGAFNNYAITTAEKLVAEYGKERCEIVALGKKGRDHFRKRGLSIAHAEPDMGGNLDVDLADQITDLLVERFTSEQTDRVYVIYNSFKNMMEYNTKRFELLPLEPEELLREHEGEDGGAHIGDMIFEPDADTVFAETLTRYLRVRLVTTLADSFTAEHSARMLAMSMASDNCDELIDSLTLERNKARQASITKELLEIVGGAEALK